MSLTDQTIALIQGTAKLPSDAVQELIDRVNRDVAVKSTWTSDEVRLMVLQAAVEAMRVVNERIKQL